MAEQVCHSKDRMRSVWTRRHALHAEVTTGPKWLPPNLPDHVLNAWIFAWCDCLEMNTVQEISDIYQKS